MFMAALQYDAVMLIDSAVRAVKGKVEDKDAFRAALRKADFPSVRGEFKFNVNHYPIQDHYIVRIAKDDEGVLMHQLVAKATEDHKDHYFAKCPMKW
jgi:branched-chain amino acid transport system substrate-binding protein